MLCADLKLLQTAAASNVIPAPLFSEGCFVEHLIFLFKGRGQMEILNNVVTVSLSGLC